MMEIEGAFEPSCAAGACVKLAVIGVPGTAASAASAERCHEPGREERDKQRSGEAAEATPAVCVTPTEYDAGPRVLCTVRRLTRTPEKLNCRAPAFRRVCIRTAGGGLTAIEPKARRLIACVCSPHARNSCPPPHCPCVLLAEPPQLLAPSDAKSCNVWSGDDQMHQGKELAVSVIKSQKTIRRATSPSAPLAPTTAMTIQSHMMQPPVHGQLHCELDIAPD